MKRIEPPSPTLVEVDEALKQIGLTTAAYYRKERRAQTFRSYLLLVLVVLSIVLIVANVCWPY